MDEALNLIHVGCERARDLELSLPTMASQPDLLSSSCQDIMDIFSAAKQRIDCLFADSLQWHPHVQQDPLCTSLGPGISIPPSNRLGGTRTERRDEGTGDVAMGGDIHDIPAADVSQGGEPSTLSRRRNNRRSSDEERRTFLVSASRIGNPEIPPDDGYTWRKYGQKEILGSRFPRGYFRCTHQKLYQCPAKKLVQRLDHDPSTFEVTYRHHHTCHMSSTAPSAVHPPSLQHLITSQDTTTHVLTAAPTQASITSAAGPSSNAWMPTAFDIGGMNVGGDIAGPSTIGDPELNYGEGHSGGLDPGFFSYSEEHWKGEDQK
ncbi:hypothetical protein MLD38_003622 [Melastoma candidum]|uniref:Uncharacterized protein n=1 Tax=Melastoma candidum TaxID=119954 RepID=A0ACB9S2N2_9MYRT|nr:hypothetical protein MLD38_003622 [Melastoma candidum]